MTLQAYQVVLEFEQVLKNSKLGLAAHVDEPSTTDTYSTAATPASRSSVCLSDVDDVCSMCYNWGVTLVELGQILLAEKFVCKAIDFIAHSSEMMEKFRDTIQVCKVLMYIIC
jgi:hypothetical protein